MPWQKGQSGNPGGRPKVVGEIRDLARQHTATAIDTLVQVCKSGESESARVAAAQVLLDRGWGRPLQMTELSAIGSGEITFRWSDGAASVTETIGQQPVAVETVDPVAVEAVDSVANEARRLFYGTKLHS